MIEPLDPESAFVTIAGGRYCYRRVGQGPPMLLIHGMGETSKVTWRELIPYFKDWYTLIAVDLRGYGDSERPQHGYRLIDQALVVAGMIDQLQLEQPIVVGHSLGGIIAAKCALCFPDKISKLVLYDSPIGGEYSPNFSVLAKMPVPGLLLMFALFIPGLGKYIFERRTPSMVRLVLSSMKLFRDPAAYTADVLQEGSRQSYEALTQGAWHAIGFQNIFHDLVAIRMPTLIIRGQYDVLASQYWTVRVHERIAHSQLVIIPNAAHQALNEQPVLFNQALERFLLAQG